MSVSYKQFLDTLYVEHIEESASLFDLVASFPDDREMQWTEAHEFECRMRAHIDGLVIGGESALLNASELASDGPGELYTLVSLVLALGREENLSIYLADLDLYEESQANVFAIVAALLEYGSAQQLTSMIQQLSDGSAQWVLSIAIARAAELTLGRLPQDWLHKCIDQGYKDEEYFSLAGILDSELFKDCHYTNLLSESELLRYKAIKNLHSIDRLSLQSFLNGTPVQEDAEKLCLVHNLPDQKIGSEESSMSLSSSDAIKTVAVAGQSTSVAKLLEVLDSDFAEVSAEALFSITGAELFEETFVEEVIKEDDLLEHEREAYEKGENPRKPDGRPYGENVVCLSTDAAVWKTWLVENKSRFKKDVRYRLGRPMNASVLCSTIQHAMSPQWLRMSSEVDLCCRFGMPVTYPWEGSVSRQHIQLQKMQQWLSSNNIE